MKHELTHILYFEFYYVQVIYYTWQNNENEFNAHTHFFTPHI